MKFKLVIDPAGKTILATTERLDPEQVEHVRKAWDEWKKGGQSMMFLMETDVIVATKELDIELDIES